MTSIGLHAYAARLPKQIKSHPTHVGSVAMLETSQIEAVSINYSEVYDTTSAGVGALVDHSASAKATDNEVPTEVVAPVTADVGHPGAAEQEMIAAAVVETKNESCYCASFDLKDYQVWPKNEEGNRCVGGCGGSRFRIQKTGGTIKEIRVWTSNGKSSHIRAIRWTWHNGDTKVKGKPAQGDGPWSFNFDAGEYVSGDVLLSGNGIGTRLGSIEFTTSAGRNFRVGMKDPHRFHFPSGGAYFGGFFGRAGLEIDQLAVIFWKPIANIQYESLSYPTLTTLAQITTPEKLVIESYCNIVPPNITYPGREETLEVENGLSSCVTTEATTQFGTELTLKGGVPFVNEVEAKASWERSQSTTVMNCAETIFKRTRTVKYPSHTVLAGVSFEVFHRQWGGRLDQLPFEARLRVTFKDSSNFTRKETGTYDGASFSRFESFTANYQDDVTEC